MQRKLTLFKNTNGQVEAKQQYPNDERINRAMKALAKFRGQFVDNSDELRAAVMENNGHWTTFCVEDILNADSSRLYAYQTIYKEIMGKDSTHATGKDMLDATFPKSGMGIPWGHPNSEIVERFPSTIDILVSRKPGWW